MNKNKSLILSCPACGFISKAPLGDTYFNAFCPKCRFKIFKSRYVNKDLALCFSLCALALFIPANLIPIMYIEFSGEQKDYSILQSIKVLYKQGFYLASIATLLTLLIIPFIKLSSIIIAIKFIKAGDKNKYKKIFLYFKKLKEWSMLDIYILAIIISSIKLYDDTYVGFLEGFYIFILFAIFDISASIYFNRSKVLYE